MKENKEKFEQLKNKINDFLQNIKLNLNLWKKILTINLQNKLMKLRNLKL